MTEATLRTYELNDQDRERGYGVPASRRAGGLAAGGWRLAAGGWRLHSVWHTGPEGPYTFVVERDLPRFPEVRQLNDRILALVEGMAEWRRIVIRFFELGDGALHDRSEQLRRTNDLEWQAIRDDVEDLFVHYGFCCA